MSNLLTTTPPRPSPPPPPAIHLQTSVTCSHNTADKMFRLPDSGMPERTSAQLGRLFTSWRNDDLHVLIMHHALFGHSVPVYELTHTQTHLSLHFKAQLNHIRSAIRSKYCLLVTAATLQILFYQLLHTQEKAPYSGFVFVTK